MSADQTPVPRRRAAASPQEHEDRLILKAMHLAEKQIDDETASQQVISHYLKLGSSRERLEQQRLAGEVSLNRIKEETLASEKRIEVLLTEGFNAFRSYSPTPQEGEDFYEDEDLP